MRGREYCESCLFLDVRRLARLGQLRLSDPFEVSWQCAGKIIGTVEIASGADCIKLRFLLKEVQPGVCNEVNQTIPIVWSSCAFGGRRPWFLCPTINHEGGCRARAAILYLGRTPLFACRKCHDLAYASQFESVGQRGIQRARYIRTKLGGGPNLLAKFPARPKGMHRQTYLRLRASYKKAAVRCGALSVKPSRYF
jgi:hypothetical protein